MTVAQSQKIYSVSELTQAIKVHLEPKFFHVCLKGEITNFTQQTSGHLYFNLKDDKSQISCVLFKNVAITLQKLPKSGDKVLIRGSLSLYVPRGNYQIVISHLQQEGLGELLLKLHELKDKFHKKGYFDPSHKKPLPKYPKTIGVVTSPTGAVIHDILTVLQRRFHGFHLILNPVKVQGEGADKEIAQAIVDFNRFNLVDVIIVGRGGGSLEDLWAFNEECVVEAIFASKIPVISSVGHETDLCLADFVADVRAPTPSAAAEIVMKEKSLQLQFLDNSRKTLTYHANQLLQHHSLKLQKITKQKLFLTPEAFLGDYFQKIDDKMFHLQNKMQDVLKTKSLHLAFMQKRLNSCSPEGQLERLREKNLFFNKTLNKKILAIFETRKQQLQHLKEILHLKNPLEILKKGYCIPFAENSRSVIISSKQPKPGDILTLQFYDGQVKVAAHKDVHG